MRPVDVVHKIQRYRTLVVRTMPDASVREAEDGLGVDHALFMIEAMERGVADGTWPEQKLMRWFGWLQCLVVQLRLRTLDEMREDNRAT